jgi:tetratricopeptide (TPR) repeat protein
MPMRRSVSTSVATRVVSLVCGLLLVVAAKAEEVPGTSAATPAGTLAHELLNIEFGGAEHHAEIAVLDQLIDAAITRVRAQPPVRSERARAREFFRAVDAALIDAGVIFPPAGSTELLRDGLKPRQMQREDFEQAFGDWVNVRRVVAMGRIHRAGGSFYVMDCDISSLIYLAAAERLGLPVFAVDIPEHVFVRWSSPGVSLNWDTNEGETFSDEEYALYSGVTKTSRRLDRHLQNMSRQRLRSSWLMIASNRKEEEGRFPEALADLRRALQEDPDDLETINNLAWFLATCKDDCLRNGPEAVALQEPLCALWPRANWLDTLAAAYAEAGRFEEAIATERHAKDAVDSEENGLEPGETPASFDECIAAYERGITYAAGVQQGLIHEPEETEIGE